MGWGTGKTLSICIYLLVFWFHAHLHFLQINLECQTPATHHILLYQMPLVLVQSIIGFTCEKQIESSWTKIESSNYVTILDICSVQGSALKDELCKLPGLTRKKRKVSGFFFLPLQFAAGQYYSKLRNLKCYWLQHFFFCHLLWQVFWSKDINTWKESFNCSQKPVTWVILQPLSGLLSEQHVRVLSPWHRRKGGYDKE